MAMVLAKRGDSRNAVVLREGKEVREEECRGG